MTPEKLADAAPDCAVSFDGREAMIARPAFGPLIAEAISLWSEAETMMGIALVQMLGAEAEPATAMYQVIRTTSHQTEAVNAVAAATLQEPEYGLFDAVSWIFAQEAKNRNMLAHGMYGYTDALPDALLVCAPRDFQKHWLNLSVKQHILPHDTASFVQQAGKEFYQNILVFREDIFSR